MASNSDNNIAGNTPSVPGQRNSPTYAQVASPKSAPADLARPAQNAQVNAAATTCPKPAATASPKSTKASDAKVADTSSKPADEDTTEPKTPSKPAKVDVSQATNTAAPDTVAPGADSTDPAKTRTTGMVDLGSSVLTTPTTERTGNEAKASRPVMSMQDWSEQIDMEDQQKAKAAKREEVKRQAAEELAKYGEISTKDILKNRKKKQPIKTEKRDSWSPEPTDSTPTVADVAKDATPAPTSQEDATDKKKRAGEPIASPPKKKAKAAKPKQVSDDDTSDTKAKELKPETISGRIPRQKNDMRKKIIENAYHLADGNPDAVKPKGKLEFEFDENQMQYDMIDLQNDIAESKNKEYCKNAPTVPGLVKAKILQKGKKKQQLDGDLVKYLKSKLNDNSEPKYYKELSSYNAGETNESDFLDMNALSAADVQPAQQVLNDLKPPPQMTWDEKLEYRKKLADLEEALAERDAQIANLKKDMKLLGTLMRFRKDNPEVWTAWTQKMASAKAEKEQRDKERLQMLQQLQKEQEEAQREREKDELYLDQFDGVYDAFDHPHNAIDAAIKAARDTTTTVLQMLHDYEELRQFARGNPADFEAFKQRRAADVWYEIDMHHRKIAELEKEFDALCGEDAADTDYIEDHISDSSDISNHMNIDSDDEEYEDVDLEEDINSLKG